MVHLVGNLKRFYPLTAKYKACLSNKIATKRA